MPDQTNDADDTQTVIRLLRAVVVLLGLLAAIGLLSYFKLADIADAVG